MVAVTSQHIPNYSGRREPSVDAAPIHLATLDRYRLIFLVLSLVLTTQGAAFGEAICNDNWNVNTGNWSVKDNWTQGLPGKASDVCLTNGTEKQPASTTLDVTSTIDGLTIGTNSSLFLDNKDLNVTGNANNSGYISGTGTLSIKNMVNGGTIAARSGNTLSIKNSTVDNFRTINGFSLPGEISAFGGLKVGTVSIQNSTINGGLLQVIDFGKIVVDNSVIQYRPGSPRGPGSSPRIVNSSVGVIEFSGTSTVTLADVTNPKGGQIQVDQNSELQFGGLIHNNGSVKLLGSRLRIVGNLTLDGTGSLQMQPGSMITATGNLNSLTNESNIVGSGTIGNMFLQNTGNIFATGSLGISPNPIVQNGAAAINTGTMGAGPGGTLTLGLGRYDNFSAQSKGLIVALGVPGLPSGTVSLRGATVNGGNIATVGTGVIDMLNSSLNNAWLFNNPLGTVDILRGGVNPVTFNTDMLNLGSVAIADGAVLNIKAGHSYTNVGTIALNADANNGSANLVIEKSDKFGFPLPVFLTGNGTVTLSDSAGNHITGATGKETLTNVNNLIQGAGSIDDLILFNQGTIRANAPNNPLIIKTNGTVSNSGTMQAVSGSTLKVMLSPALGGFVNANGGILQARGNNSQVQMTVPAGQIVQSFGTISAQNGTVAFGGQQNLGGQVWNSGAINALSGGTIDFTQNGGVNISNFKGGTITVYKDGTIHSDKQLNNGDAGVDIQKGGVLDPSLYSQESGGYTRDDGFLEADQISVNGGILFGTGTLQGRITNGGTFFAGDGMPNGGGIPIDPIAGTMTINGDYLQTGSGTLHELMQSYSAFSRTVISGSDFLNGTLDIDLDKVLAGQLKVGVMFEIMDARSVSGKFSNVEGEYIGNGLSFEVLYDPPSECKGGLECVLLEVVPTPEPGSMLLFGSGFLCLSRVLRMRIHKASRHNKETSTGII